MPPAQPTQQPPAHPARGRVAGTARTLQDIAQSCGFGNAERMRRTFIRLFGAPPSAVKYHGR
jgi:transcriptional regulator GlxA family with amidase domain